MSHSLVVHELWVLVVVGSNPSIPTNHTGIVGILGTNARDGGSAAAPLPSPDWLTP